MYRQQVQEIEKAIAEIDAVADDIAREGQLVRAARVRKAAMMMRVVRMLLQRGWITDGVR